MRNLKRIFKDIEPGTKCTGTICLFRLSVKQLMENAVIERRGMDYYFLGFPDATDATEYVAEDQEIAAE